MHGKIVLSAFLALGAFAALPAAAQDATLGVGNGDSLSVSGNGTHGTLQGLRVDNSKTSYTVAAANAPAVSVGNGGSFTLGPGGSLTSNPGGPPGFNYYHRGIEQYGGSVTITGGSVSGTDAAVQNYGGVITITGGTFTGTNGWALELYPTSASGVASQPTAYISGGTFVSQSPEPNIILGPGQNLDLFGTFSGYAPGATITGPGSGLNQGMISGTWLDGTPASVTYGVAGTGVIEFNVGPAPAPEPSAAVGLVLGSLCLSMLVFTARRRMTCAVGTESRLWHGKIKRGLGNPL